tara:strand:- start:132 stop:449 length:318 start_codon:yes stop_codon:yes gene_type:complete
MQDPMQLAQTNHSQPSSKAHSSLNHPRANLDFVIEEVVADSAFRKTFVTENLVQPQMLIASMVEYRCASWIFFATSTDESHVGGTRNRTDSRGYEMISRSGIPIC